MAGQATAMHVARIRSSYTDKQGLSAGRGNHGHGPGHPGEGAPPAMSGPAPHTSPACPPQACAGPPPVPVSAPGTALPLRPRPDQATATHRAPADMEILQRVKAALNRL